MSIIPALPNTLINGTTADATVVMADLNFIVSNVNANGAHSGANSDITSLSGMTTPLSIAQGGTGTSIAPTVVTNYFPGCQGLTLTAPATQTVGVAAGAVGVAAGGQYVLPSAFTKTFSNFTAGTGNGGLDTGTVAANTWYYLFIIYNSSATPVYDVLISNSALYPTIPTGYACSPTIGAIRTDGSSHILAFTQVGNDFYMAVPINVISGGGVTSGGPNTITMPGPTGINNKALFDVSGYNNGAYSAYFNFYSPGIYTSPPSAASSYNYALATGASFSAVQGVQFLLQTNTAQAILYTYNGGTAGSTVISVNWLGFTMLRGLN
jgi:hypothetical protein